MKRVVCIHLILVILISMCTMTVYASGSSSEKKSSEEAYKLLVDPDRNDDYYRQFLKQQDPIFVVLAESYLANKPQFYLTNAWSDILNEEYRRKGTSQFKNEYIYDLVIIGFLKYEANNVDYYDGLSNRTLDFFNDLNSVSVDKLQDAFEKSEISDSTMDVYRNIETIKDLNLAMSVVEYAGESYESYLDIMASKMALLEAKRDKLALFRASVDKASNNGDKEFANAMNIIIDSIDNADPEEYLYKKTDKECSNILISVVEDVVKEVNPIFGLMDLSVSGIDLLFNTSENASNDIKLAYLYLTDSYLRQGLYSISDKCKNYNDPSDISPENAREFIDAFKTYLRFQQYGNNYADEWLDNYIQERSGFIKRWFHKKEIQNAKDIKEQCKSENTRIGNMLNNINGLEEEEDVWKIIPEKKEDKVTDTGTTGSSGYGDNNIEKKNTYIDIINALLSQYGALRIVQNNGNWANEANGLCYLNLIDFTGDGEDELMAVCKNENEDHYTCYIYQKTNNQVKQIFINEQAECNFDFDFESIYIFFSKDTGYILGSGWIGDESEDCTFYWYKDGLLEPVYRNKGFWDSEQDKYISQEKNIVVDLFDDAHYDEIWNNSESITLRTYYEYDGDNDLFSSHKLQKTIEDTLNKLGISLKDLSTSNDSDLEEPSENKDEHWKKSYIEFIEADPDISMSDSCICGLIYLDNDDIPELIIEYGVWALGTKIVTYKNGELLSRSFAGEGGISYIERKGFVHNAVAHMGTMTDEFESLDKDGFHDLGIGTRYGDAEDYVHYTDFQWNWDNVTEEEYNKYVKSVFDEGQAKRWNAFDDVSPDGVYSVASMLNYLREVSSSQQGMQSDSKPGSVTDSFTMEEFGIPYGYYYGGIPQGDGIFGLEVNLYEDLTFSIISSFDIFSDDSGDEYLYEGTYGINRVDEDGKPVLHFHCNEGDFELIWDGEELRNDTFFVMNGNE